ncbi:hypothetical protein P1J78_08345 [Psychromarinibacter sp. C21-152]|uniref:Uncharacterized protein n=1 Tax=Psychromarinibacter sediminicola TaxID=3033385 RepID=A0AAE3NUC2_9RHOB|nr:hypothetical protein [Psychromarinibacter sediminicola]MDF0600737.1 hypothetical protein [Psychromarinibacter sediminicola]
MDEKALVHLLSYGLTWEKLRRIPEEHLAALSVISYAASELNALRRIYLTQPHEPCDVKPVDSAASIQKLVILRSWSSKLFEVAEFVEFGGRKPTTSDSKLLALSSRAVESFSELKSGEGYQVARIVRHEASNHYSFSAAKKNLPNVPKNMDCDFYVGEMGGNSFFPLGEAVMFHARLSRKWAAIEPSEQRQKLFEEWLDWCLKASRWVDEVHADFADQLLFEAFKDRKFKKKVYWVPLEYVGHHSEHTTPVFLKKEP